MYFKTFSKSYQDYKVENVWGFWVKKIKIICKFRKSTKINKQKIKKIGRL